MENPNTNLKVMMTRNPLFLKIWGIAIIALGAWHVRGWVIAEQGDKSTYAMVIGAFCILVGVGVFVLSLGVNGKRDK